MSRKKKLKSYLYSFYAKAAGVVVATTVSDFIWAKYMASVSGATAMVAANWSVCIIAIGAFLTLSYVEDKRLVIPACIGAWIGTYLAI